MSSCDVPSVNASGSECHVRPQRAGSEAKADSLRATTVAPITATTASDTPINALRTGTGPAAARPLGREVHARRRRPAARRPA